MFELKANKSSETVSSGVQQLQKGCSLIGNEKISTFVVFPKNAEHGFEFVNKNGDTIDNEKILEASLNYNNLCNFWKNEKFEEVKSKEKNQLKFIKCVCYIAAPVVFAIGVLSNFFCFSIDSIDISLILIVIALLLIPSYREVKIFALELKELIGDKEDEDNKKNNKM